MHIMHFKKLTIQAHLTLVQWEARTALEWNRNQSHQLLEQSESAALTFCLQQAANQKTKVQEWKYRTVNGKNISNSKTQPSSLALPLTVVFINTRLNHKHVVTDTCISADLHTHFAKHTLTFARHKWFNEGSHLWSNYAVIHSSAWLIALVNWLEPHTT